MYLWKSPLSQTLLPPTQTILTGVELLDVLLKLALLLSVWNVALGTTMVELTLKPYKWLILTIAQATLIARAVNATLLAILANALPTLTAQLAKFVDQLSLLESVSQLTDVELLLECTELVEFALWTAI